MKKLICTLAVTLVFFGCATVNKKDIQNMSSGYIGCNPDEIQVGTWQPGYGYSNWDAACHGKQYRCTASLGGTSCKELQTSTH